MFYLFKRSLTIFNEGLSLTIVNEGLSLTVVKKECFQKRSISLLALNQIINLQMFFLVTENNNTSESPGG